MAVDPSAATLFFEIVSVSPTPLLELAGRIAAVLDGAGPFAPTRGGFSARTTKLDRDGVRGLLGRATERNLRNGLWLVFEQRERGVWGDIRIHDDTRLGTAPRTHSVDFTLPLDGDTATADVQAAIDLMCALFVAAEGFYGRADTVAMRNRRLALRTAAADEGRMWLPRWNDPSFVIWDRWIEDVWWINLFGPAYVARWGAERIGRMGVAQRSLPNGGIAIWSAADPPDPHGSDSIAGYPHKQSFYDAAGVETFIHESLHMPPPGSLVPALHEHARTGR